MKECRDCERELPLEAFSPSKKNKDGRVSYCRDCFRVRHRAYRDARAGRPPTKRSAVRASSAEVKWCPACREERPKSQFGNNRSQPDGLTNYCLPCHNASARANVIKNHGSTRDAHLKRRYGITSADVDRMVEAQGGVCAVCMVKPPQHVDHDHVTGLVRGVLCSTCNQGLGSFGDDASRMRRGAAYLESLSWQRGRAAPGVVRLVPPTGEPVAVAAADLGPLLAAGRRRACRQDRRRRPAVVARRRRT